MLPTVFHSLFLPRTDDGKPYLTDFSICILIASAMMWKHNGGRIYLFIEEESEKAIKKHRLDMVYDAVIPIKRLKDVDPVIFGVTAKYAGFLTGVSNISIDTDIIFWKPPKLALVSDLDTFHIDNRYEYYLNTESYRQYGFDSTWDFNTDAFNCAYCGIHNNDLKKLFLETSIEFMKKYTHDVKTEVITKRRDVYIWAEQQLLAMASKKLFCKNNFLTVTPLSLADTSNHWHVWGEKAYNKPKKLKKKFFERVRKYGIPEIIKVLKFLDIDESEGLNKHIFE
jgi:hypothetical protein